MDTTAMEKFGIGKPFGFGCMRLPTMDPGDAAAFDFPKMEMLVDAFLDAGYTYFDTAYTYHGYKAEEAVRKALVDRHPRESFLLATKMPLRDFRDTADLQRIFDEQLVNCGVDRFDFYLLHNMGSNVYEKCRTYGAFDFLARMKEEGKARFVGMSFHDTPELLDVILGEYADVLDFVQLQINYLDWESADIQSKRCWGVARRYGMPIAVMEPCKGGTLVNLPDEAREMLAGAEPDAPTASWALRFAASRPGVFMVLSGMNEVGQLRENTAVFDDFEPLDADEEKLVERVAQTIKESTAISCTACEYCTHDCPKDIPIPRYFALYNSAMRTTGSFSSQNVYYNNVAIGHGKASDCVRCGLCEQACPQHLPIRELLESVVDKFEAHTVIPTRK